MIYQPCDTWLDDVVTRASLVLLQAAMDVLSLFLSDPPEPAPSVARMPANRPEPAGALSDAPTTPEAAKTEPCPDCAKLRDALSHAKLDIDFWKGETDLAKSGTDAVRAVFETHGISSGSLQARAERACKTAEDATKRAVNAENELRTLKAQHEPGVTDTTDPQTAAAKAAQ